MIDTIQSAPFDAHALSLKSGDTLIVLAGNYPIHPNTVLLKGLSDVTIIGVNNPIIEVDGHGDGILLQDCLRCSISGLTIRGKGYLTTPNTHYFALIHLEGSNEQLSIEHCTLEDSGNHGIGALHVSGPPATNNSTFAHNTIRRCGNLRQTALVGDGAAIAVGGSNNRFDSNVIEDCLRGIELECPFPACPTQGNVITGNSILRSFWHAIVAIPQHGDAEAFASNVIEKNVIMGRGSLDPRSLGWDKQQHMVELWGGVGWRITGNVLADSLDWCGLALDPDKCDIRDVEVRGNVFTHLGRGGVWARPNKSNTVSNVRIFDNTFGTMNGNAISVEGDRITIGENRWGQLVGADATGKPWKRVQCVGKDNHVPVDATL